MLVECGLWCGGNGKPHALCIHACVSSFWGLVECGMFWCLLEEDKNKILILLIYVCNFNLLITLRVLQESVFLFFFFHVYKQKLIDFKFIN